MRTYTTYALAETYYVRVWLFMPSNLLRMCTALRVSNLCIWGTAFARKATYASRSFLIASTWQWQSMVSIFKFAMTVYGVLDCTSLCDNRRWSVRLLPPSWFVAPEDLSEGCDIPYFLCDNIDFRLGSPSWRMRSSIISLRRSWLPIGPSFLSCLEDSAVIFLQRWSVRFKTRPSPDDDYLLNPV